MVVTFEEHPMLLELFALHSHDFINVEWTLGQGGFTVVETWVCRCKTHLIKAPALLKECVLFHERFYECECSQDAC